MPNKRLKWAPLWRIATFLCILIPSVGASQAPEARKKVLTPDTYDSWRSIVGSVISPDGKWVAYTLTPAVGDGEVIIRATGGSKEYHVPRGFTGRPLNSTTGTPFVPGDLKFTADGRRLIFLRYEPKAEFEKAKREMRKEPRTTVVIVELDNGTAKASGTALSFTLPKNTSRYLFYLAPRDSIMRDSASLRAAATPGGAARPISKDSTGKGRFKLSGTMLTIEDFVTGQVTTIDDVDSYVVDDDATWLAYAVSSSKSSGRDGVYLRRLATSAEVSIMTGLGHYKGLVLDRKARQLAFLSDRAEYGSPRPRYALYYSPTERPRLRQAVEADAFGKDTILATSRIAFSKNGSVIRFGVMPIPPDSIPQDSLADKAVYDLWNYKDARLQTEQKTMASKERERALLTLYNIGARRIIRVGNDSAPNGTLSDDGRWVFVTDETPYTIASMWEDEAADLYVIDVLTGSRIMLARQKPVGPVSFSPLGRFVTWFDRGNWFTYDLRTGATTNVTGALAPVRFDNETNDTPSVPAPWGLAGWTKGDSRMLVYSRFDIWSIDPTGETPATMVTDSVGTREKLVFRILRPRVPEPEEFEEFEDLGFDPAEPLLLSAMNNETKSSGFYQAQLNVPGSLERILMDSARFGKPVMARRDGTYLVTRETERDFPNLYAGRALTALARISDANPQQSEYRWPSAELVRWVSNDGEPLSGILYKPEDFDPSRKYPMVVYFYERLSDNLHAYNPPSGRNVVNPSVYTSRGYLVFEPDIAYTIGYPGTSAVKSVVPGVQMLLARGFVKADAIGCAGQSWGGYQAAFMVTQTKLFKACFVGAPVANMTSAYGAIRWETGHSRQIQYERTQSRIGGSLWAFRDRYIENSPLFYADRIETPLLIMSNDNDGAVPWYQGIELFSALRRLGKEAYMVSYNGDGHNPLKYANKKDIDMKMLQFFGHHLLGEAAPDWMARGIPFLQKGRDQLPPTVGAPSVR